MLVFVLLVNMTLGRFSQFEVRQICFLKIHIQVELDVVDIDPSMVTIATEWFGFCPDDTMRAHVADGLEFLKSEADKGLSFFYTSNTTSE